MTPENIDFQQRYSRQIAIDYIGEEGQKKLSQGRVLVLGCGALGSMVAMQLCGAGVGKLIIADFDNIDISNLQRQFFYKTQEASQSKAVKLKERMNDLNPDVEVKLIEKFVTPPLAREIFKEADFIIDATDNPSSKIMTDNVSRETDRYCCIGGVTEFRGQVLTLKPEDDLRYNELFHTDGDSEFMPCSIGGVMGPAAAFCASIQSSEALKFLLKKGDLLTGKLFTFDLYNDKFNIFRL